MFTKPGSPALRALLWVLVVLLPGGFLLLPFLGADVVRRRLRQEQVAVKHSEAPPRDASGEPEAPEITETRERPSGLGPIQGSAESNPPAPRRAA